MSPRAGVSPSWRHDRETRFRRARTPAGLLAFAHGAEAHDFDPASRAEACGHIRNALRRFPYERLSRAERGMLRAYLQKSAGFSRAQPPRLSAQCRDTGRPRDRRRAAPVRTQRPARAAASRRRAPGRPLRPLRRAAGPGPVFPQLRRPGHAVETGAARAASAHEVRAPGAGSRAQALPARTKATHAASCFARCGAPGGLPARRKQPPEKKGAARRPPPVFRDRGDQLLSTSVIGSLVAPNAPTRSPRVSSMASSPVLPRARPMALNVPATSSALAPEP